jgi:hypothetical protein
LKGEGPPGHLGGSPKTHTFGTATNIIGKALSEGKGIDKTIRTTYLLPVRKIFVKEFAPNLGKVAEMQLVQGKVLDSNWSEGVLRFMELHATKGSQKEIKSLKEEFPILDELFPESILKNIEITSQVVKNFKNICGL